MQEISRLRMLEIFLFADDLEVVIEKGEDGKLAVGIFRGKSEAYRPIVASQPIAGGIEAIVGAVGELLARVLQEGEKELRDEGNIPVRLFNLEEGRVIDRSRILSAELVGRILEELREHHAVSTCKMLQHS